MMEGLEREAAARRSSTERPVGPPEEREGERSEPALTGGGPTGAAPDPVAGMSRPNPEVVAQARRRTFSLKFKLRLLAEADKCANGELGALLRREGIYDSTYRTWRRQREEGILSGLAPKPRGPAPRPADPQAKRVAELERENRKLSARLEKAELIIEIQKKVAALLGIELATPEDRRDR